MNIKLLSYVAIVLLFFPMIVPAVMNPSVAQSEDRVLDSIGTSGNTQDDTSAQPIVLSIGKTTLTFIVKEPARRVLILYEAEGWTITEEVVVSLGPNGYDTEMYMDGVLVDHRVRDVNVLEPVLLTPVKPTFSGAGIEQPPLLQASYTYEWWDSIRFVNGPYWQVKYPHPYRDFYGIATFYDWSIFGTKLIHMQINSYASGILATLGWSALFAAVGAYMGEYFGGGGYMVAAGAVLGAVFGIIFGYATQAVLCDEAGCIWWWSSRAYGDWMAANAWWIWWLSLIPGGANGFTITAFLLYGYLRIGSWPFYDAVGAGSP